MVKPSEHPEFCMNANELGKLRSEVNTLNNIVMEKGGLAQTVPVLSDNVSKLTETIGDLTTGVSGLLQFQENQLGQEKGKEMIRTRNRWLIGATITLLGIITGVLVGIYFG